MTNEICRFCKTGIHLVREPRKDEPGDWVHDSGYYGCFDEERHQAEPLNSAFEFAEEVA